MKKLLSLCLSLVLSCVWGGTIFAYDGSDTTTLNLEQN